MSNSRDRAIRLMELYVMLTQESNEEHPLTLQDMRFRLDKMDLHCGRQSIYDDLNTLAYYRIPLEKKKMGKYVGYYCPSGYFNPGELEVLFDAVQACSFISPDDTGKLIDKIVSQSGCLEASQLAHSLIRFNTRKQQNRQIFSTVETCVKAVREHRRLSFLYFHYDFSGRREYDYDGEPITVEPLFPVFQDDRLYLVAWAPARQGIRHYRMDRIADPAILPVPVSEEALSAMPDPGEFTKSTFRMYGGEDTEVTLEFEKSALGSVFDKFGFDIEITPLENNRGQITRTVTVSPLFFSWLDQYEGKITILSPASVREQYREHLAKLLSACGN